MENLNSVCYITTITDIQSIEGADKIELAVAGGWNCVVQKNKFKMGELVIVITTDAVIPQELAISWGVDTFLRKGFRVRTVKLKGVYSECILLSVYSLPKNIIPKNGIDLMDVFKIYKYEPPARMINLSSGRTLRYKDNPNFKIYYKFPNVKNVPDMFTSSDYVEVTRKLHGTNARYGIVKKSKITLLDKIKKFFGNKFSEYEFVVGSHNVEKGSDSQGYYDTNVWYTIENKYEIKRRLWRYVQSKYSSNLNKLGSGVIVYGEIYGSGIQKNYDYGIGGIEFRIFDITIDDHYQDVDTVRMICKEEIGLPYVQILYTGYYSKDIVDNFVLDQFIFNTKIPHEGVVVKSITGSRNKIAKFINPAYLVYSEKHNVEDSH
jgi:RNA ligase (TIGR02306 family)